jgi:predicted MFS family arabinose efflux permease
MSPAGQLTSRTKPTTPWRMQFDQPSRAEWKRGWPIVAGAMSCSAFGIPLFYYVFSIFTLPITKEFGITPGELSRAQALLVVGALVAPLIGRAFDRLGFRIVFGLCSLAVILTHVVMASFVYSFAAFAVAALVYGVAGVGCGPLAFTRPINAWFWHQRGLALGVTAIGVAITTAVASPMIEALIASQGWRAGFWALAIIAGGLGLPLSLWLIKDAPPEAHVAETPASNADSVAADPIDQNFLLDRDFILLVLSILCMAIPGSGLVSQISPLVQEEGISASAAAFGVSAYAIGQVTGRIVTGWFLDRSNPRMVAFLFTFVPAAGFIVLATMAPPLWLIILAVGLVGIQQGAEIDLFAFFTARRFGMARYGQIYGWIIAAAWLGNAAGILLFGWLHDETGSFAMAEAIGAALFVIAALLIAAVRIAPTAAAAALVVPEEQVEPAAARLAD